MTQQAINKQREQILKGLALAYKRMLEFKKQKNSFLVVMKEQKIIKIKP